MSMLSNCSRRLAPLASRPFKHGSLARARAFCVGGGDQLHFPGAPNARTTPELKFVEPLNEEPIPCFRAMQPDGTVPNEEFARAFDEGVNDETKVKMLETMLKLNIMDNKLMDVQRVGDISFYMTNYGEEASHIGSSAALSLKDMIFAQYREAGVLMWRGMTYEHFCDQCFSNCDEPAHGRQMPVHYGSKELNFVTISSTLATQMPQASGAAYALKRKGEKACVVCYFGDGAASEGDAHAAFNFAATTDSPCVFICRNNGFAISTPTTDQYRGDGIASRGSGYGIPTIRVDGNDLIAVYLATKEAKRRAIEESTPVLMEIMSYRIGHHSTSDDSTAYRPKQEVAYWKEEDGGIARFRQYLVNKGLWNKEQEAETKKNLQKEFLAALRQSQKKLKPSIRHMFSDVYDEKPRHLIEQEEQMWAHVKKYKDARVQPDDPNSDLVYPVHEHVQ